MPTRLLMVCVLASLLNTTGCGTSRVVFVDTTRDMVRLGGDVRGHVYYFKDGSWIKSKNKVTLPEGWVAGGVPPED